ncbi:MAG: PQQ-binding-like beta-propeller repeat protein [Cellulomonas sp.]
MVRGQLQHVILIEDTDADRDDARRDGRDRDGAGRDGAGRDGAGRDRDGAGRYGAVRRVGDLRRWWPLATALVVLLALGTAIPALRVRQRAALLAGLPGVLTPVDASLHEQWRAEGQAWGEMLALGDRVVVFGRDPAGSVGVTALDGRTGEQLWRTPFGAVTARGDITCLPPDADAAHLVCLVQSGVVTGVDPGVVTPTRLVVLAADTGQEVADRALRSDNTAAASFGSDVVVTELLPDGRAAVTRLDPTTGAARWEFRSRSGLRTPSTGPAWLYPFVENGVVVANGPVTWAFAADGTLLGEWHLRGGDWAVRGGWGLGVSVLPNGSFAVGEAGGVGLSDADYGTVSKTDARDGFPIPGPILQAVVDDGSAPQVLLTAPTGQGGVVAVSATTGERLWAAGASTWGSVLVLDRRVIQFAFREVQAFDAQTGMLLWRLPVPLGNYAKQVLTDGHLVLVPRFDATLGVAVTAVDPADGRVQWTAPLPTGTDRLVVVGGRLMVTTARDLVAMG